MHTTHLTCGKGRLLKRCRSIQRTAPLPKHLIQIIHTPMNQNLVFQLDKQHFQRQINYGSTSTFLVFKIAFFGYLLILRNNVQLLKISKASTSQIKHLKVYIISFSSSLSNEPQLMAYAILSPNMFSISHLFPN